MLAALGALGAAVASPAHGQDGGARPHVVVIVLDELPLTALLGSDLAIDAERFPNFAALASTSDWYRAAAAVSPQTSASVPAIASGTAPDPALAPTWEDHPSNILALLSGSHEVHRYESLTSLCPPEVCAPKPHAGYGTFPAEAQRGTDLMGTPRETTRPLLLFGHLVAPHLPWVAVPDGSTYPNHAPVGLIAAGGLSWGPSEHHRMLGYQRLVLQIGALDRAIGEMRAVLESRDLWDDAVVVVTADHGTHFEAGPIRSIGIGGPEVSGVPLFIKDAQQQVGRVDDRPVLTTDIVPTVLGLLGEPVPADVDGLDLLVDPIPEQRTGAFVLAGGGFVTPDQSLEGLRRVVEARGAWVVPGAGRRAVHQPGIDGELVGIPLEALGDGVAPVASWQRTSPLSTRLLGGAIDGAVTARRPVAAGVCDGIVAGAVELVDLEPTPIAVHLFLDSEACPDPTAADLVVVDAAGPSPAVCAGVEPAPPVVLVDASQTGERPTGRPALAAVSGLVASEVACPLDSIPIASPLVLGLCGLAGATCWGVRSVVGRASRRRYR